MFDTLFVFLYNNNIIPQMSKSFQVFIKVLNKKLDIEGRYMYN